MGRVMMGRQSFSGGLLLLVGLGLLAACVSPRGAEGAPAALPGYEILLDERRPGEAQVWLNLPQPAARLSPARDGDGSGIADVRCADGRPAARAGSGWSIPPGCTRIGWRIPLDDVDRAGMDASLPTAGFSRRHSYWVLPERDALLRATDAGGTAAVRLRRADGSALERRHLFPSNSQPPFYAVVGTRPSARYSKAGFTLNVFGGAPAYPWMEAIHDQVLAAWAGWRRDLVTADAPATISWLWLQPPAGAEPGYSGSAGAEAVVSQIILRHDDPDAESKARAVIATSALHEGFHTITGAAGQAWPAWVNESLANHFAIEAARGFLPAADRVFLDRFFVEPEARAPLLEAQARYSAGDGSQGQVFYTYGARFWREIERVLTNPGNASGRLAALIKQSRNFAGVNLNDAAALGAFLDRHSAGRAGPIVRCFLLGEGCAA